MFAEFQFASEDTISRVAVPLGQMADVRPAIDDRVDRRGHRRRSAAAAVGDRVAEHVLAVHA